MRALLYTGSMQVVQTGDVAKFSGRSWTIQEVEMKGNDCTGYVWVRSNDEQAQMVRVISDWVKAGCFEVR